MDSPCQGVALRNYIIQQIWCKRVLLEEGRNEELGDGTEADRQGAASEPLGQREWTRVDIR